MLKKILLALILAIAILPLAIHRTSAASQAILYFGQGCPHCALVDRYLADKPSYLSITRKEISSNIINAQEFNLAGQTCGIPLANRGVPMLAVEGHCYLGNDDIIRFLESPPPSAAETIFATSASTKTTIPTGASTPPLTAIPDQNTLTFPILIGAALVDSINPCEFAVLLILMATVLAAGNKRKALLSGFAYSLSIFISYFLMGLGLYSVVSSMQTTGLFIKIIGIAAIILGLLNLKDYFWYGKFFIMEVPMSWRPKLKSLVKSITGPISAFLVGFVVSLFLLPCTSGPYVVILSMLGHSESYFRAVLLLLLYNAIFILPMLAITVGIYFGLDVEKAEQTRNNHLKTLHLIAGIIMVAMGLALILGVF